MSLLHLELEHGSFDGPCIGTTALALVETSEPFILKLHPHLIDILDTDGSTAYRFKTSNDIVAYDKVRAPGLTTDWLLILTELNIFYVVLFIRKNSKFSHRIIQEFDLNQHRIPKLSLTDSDNRTKTIVAQKCLIAVDRKSGRFIAVHSFKGFLFIFELKPSKSNLFFLASQNKVHPDVKKNPKLAVLDKYQTIEQPIPLYIGDNTLMSLQVMQSHDPSKWWISSITKNFNLDYSLNFSILCKPKNIQLDFQYSVTIDDFPDLIIPFFGFIMLFYPTKHVIYSLPNLHLISETNNSSIIFRNDCMIYELGMNSGFRKSFQVYAFNNHNELILISSNSEFYKLQIQYDFISNLKDVRLGRRLRSQIEEDEISKVCISRWDIKDMNHHSEIGYSFNLTILNSIYYTINNQATFIKVSVNDTNISETVKNLESDMILPITTVDLEDKLTFTSTNTHVSHIVSKSFNHVVQNSAVKGIIQVGDFSVRYLEHIVEQNNNSSIMEKIELFDKNGKLLSTFDFDEFTKTTCLMPMKNFKPFLPDSNDFLESEVLHWNGLLSLSFLVLTTSNNESDYDREEDLYMRRRTEMFLFVINKEKKLELKAIAVLKCKIQTLLQLDDRNLLFLGDNVSIRFGVSLFRDCEGDKKVHIKFSKFSENSLTIPNISIVRKLEESLVLMVDPYSGVYIGKVNNAYQLETKQQLLFPWKLITCLEVFSKDMIILGDLLGNIIMLDLVYIPNDYPNAQIFSCFNVNLGGIGCIACYHPELNQNKGAKVCSFGTSNGTIISVTVYQSNCESYTKILNKAKKYLLLENSNLENSNVNLPSIKTSFDKIQLYEWLLNSSHLLKCFYPKITPITQSNGIIYENVSKENPLIYLDSL